ncbi:MAG: hypothetical protein IJ588_06300 [Prevotella sp.]|nr:hypothetical protein [Prevotella sp.]
MGDYPTLTDINAVYGDGFASDWLLPQIQNLASYTGAKNLTLKQEIELARVIATEYHHLKITEILLFFYRFKSGHYGRFYGSVDPIAITCALRDFIQERNAIIAAYDQEKRERNELEDRSKGPTLSLEQYKALKQEQNEELHHLKTIRPFIKIYESQ